MPPTGDEVHKHLRRLERVWIGQPIYFITTCTFGRPAILGTDEIATLLSDEWRDAHDRYGWAIGRMSSCRTMSISFVMQSWTLNRCQSSCKNGSNGAVNEWHVG